MHSLLQRFPSQGIAQSRTVKAASASTGAPRKRAKRLDGRLGDANWRKKLQSKAGQQAPDLLRLFNCLVRLKHQRKMDGIKKAF